MIELCRHATHQTKPCHTHFVHVSTPTRSLAVSSRQSRAFLVPDSTASSSLGSSVLRGRFTASVEKPPPGSTMSCSTRFLHYLERPLLISQPRQPEVLPCLSRVCRLRQHRFSTLSLYQDSFQEVSSKVDVSVLCDSRPRVRDCKDDGLVISRQFSNRIDAFVSSYKLIPNSAVSHQDVRFHSLLDLTCFLGLRFPFPCSPFPFPFSFPFIVCLFVCKTIRTSAMRVTHIPK